MQTNNIGYIFTLLSKIDKAKRYAQEPERFSITADKVKINSVHGTRNLTKKDKQWMCNCNFFQEHFICSHVIALKEIQSHA